MPLMPSQQQSCSYQMLAAEVRSQGKPIYANRDAFLHRLQHTYNICKIVTLRCVAVCMPTKLHIHLQAVMATDRLEREQALNTITQLRQQLRQLQQADQESCMPKQDTVRLTQHIAELDKQVADLASSNGELSTDLGRALEVAKRAMDQKSKLQEQCQSQEQQLMQWQAEAQRVRELEGEPLAFPVSYHFSLQFLSCTLAVEPG